MGGIRLSKKHGVNPSVGICFWCGEGDSVILFGAMKNDQEAPREICLNYDPCQKCREGMDLGITLIEAEDHPTERGKRPIQEDHNGTLYPTGRWLVVTEDYVSRVFPAQYAKDMLEKRRCYIQLGVVEELGLDTLEPTHKI